MINANQQTLNMLAMHDFGPQRAADGNVLPGSLVPYGDDEERVRQTAAGMLCYGLRLSYQ